MRCTGEEAAHAMARRKAALHAFVLDLGVLERRPHHLVAVRVGLGRGLGELRVLGGAAPEPGRQKHHGKCDRCGFLVVRLEGTGMDGLVNNKPVA